MSSEIKTKNLELNQWQGNEYLKREDLNEDNKKIDDAFSEVESQMKANADNITTLQNKKNIIIKTILIEAKSGWTQQSAGYFSYRISDSYITQTDVVDINFSPLDVILGKTEGIFPSTDSHNGAVYLYSKQLPKERLSATMIIQKGV